MTRPRKSDLVLDGRDVMLRLKAERQAIKGLVHVDWVRFTVRVKNAPIPTVDELFPPTGLMFIDARRERLAKVLQSIPDGDFAISAQAKTLADQVCQALGADFVVMPELRKGHDFYRHRWSIDRNGQEVGWVGFLASGDSPRQQAQASTIHVNVYGTACTFAEHGFNHRLAAIVRETEAVITRVDLALDFFEGISGGMERVRDDYMAGLMDHFGNRPKPNMVGDWCNGRERSFYIGSREAGKQTNVYEKGDQLFGVKEQSPWQRVELRYGNKLRILDADMLNRPDDHFAGASEWHASMLRQAGAQATPQSVPVKQKLATETLVAEVQRNVRWCFDTAGKSIALAFQHLGMDEFMRLVMHRDLPGRLQKFARSEVASVYERAFANVSGSGYCRPGLQPYEAATT
jgi:phage replication initiation protein